jgi:CheY-like chemotaxis protein
VLNAKSLRHADLAKWLYWRMGAGGNCREAAVLTVEVIEDDVAMRALLSEWLAGGGYRVLPRSSRCVRTAADADLVVVDVPYPPSAGAEVVTRLRAAHPGADIVGLSTWSQSDPNGASRQARLLGVQCLVGKPFSRGELLDAVASVAAKLVASR